MPKSNYNKKVMSLRQKLAIFIGLLIIFAQFLFFGPENLEEWARPESSTEKKAEQIMTNVQLFENRLEERDWELQAERAEAFSGNKDWQLYSVTIKFYGIDMEYIVNAEAATVDTATMNMKINGKVKVITSNQFEFETDSMLFDAKKRKLHSPSRTRLLSPRDKLGARVEMTSNELFADLSLNQVEALGDVVAIKDEKGKQMKIQSEEAVFHLDTKSSQFVNQVRIDYNTSKVTGALASLKYDPKKDLFSEMLVSGGAYLEDKNRVAKAEQMSVYFVKNYMKLSGKPSVIQGGDELIGEEIFLLNGGKQIKVKGAKAQIEDVVGK